VNFLHYVLIILPDYDEILLFIVNSKFKPFFNTHTLMNFIWQPDSKPSKRKKILRKTLSLITTVDEIIQLLWYAKGEFTSDEKREILNKILLLITTVDEGIKLLKYIVIVPLLAKDFFQTQEILSKIISVMNTAEEGIELFHHIAVYRIEPRLRIKILNKALFLITTAEEGRSLLRYIPEGFLTPTQENKVRSGLPLKNGIN